MFYKCCNEKVFYHLYSGEKMQCSRPAPSPRRWGTGKRTGPMASLTALGRPFAEVVLDSHPLISSAVAYVFRGSARGSRAGGGGAGQGDHDTLNLGKAVVACWMTAGSWTQVHLPMTTANMREKMNSFRPELLRVSHSLLIVGSQRRCGLTQGKTKPWDSSRQDWGWALAQTPEGLASAWAIWITCLDSSHFTG